jgi:hypothetical protein
MDSSNECRRQSIAFALHCFAANSKTFERIEDLTQVAVSEQASANAINQSKTNISTALERALQSFEPNDLKRLVLLSDGNEKSGHTGGTDSLGSASRTSKSLPCR